MIVEGINCAKELLKSNYPVEKVIIDKDSNEKQNEIISLCESRNVKIEMVDRRGIERITKSSHSQGVLSFVKPYEYYDFYTELKNLTDKDAFVLILDGIEDPHNVGALIRSAECFGVDFIIIPQNRSCEINETVFKTSAGAIAHTKIVQVVNLSQTIEKLKSENIWCYALEAGEKTLFKTDLLGRVALVVGSEGKGCSRLVTKTCDETISIPMFGNVNSLNASNAGAIAMYEVVRQRGNKK